jgi:hypothetical protein
MQKKITPHKTPPPPPFSLFFVVKKQPDFDIFYSLFFSKQTAGFCIGSDVLKGPQLSIPEAALFAPPKEPQKTTI